MCDWVNHARLPEEMHLPDWTRRDKQGTKGDRVYLNKQNVCFGVVILDEVQNTDNLWYYAV